jgi:hypothetical protein
VDDLHLSDADAQRLGRFFADLMLTLAEDGVAGTESAEAMRTLWHATPGHPSPAQLDLGAETLVHGLGGVAVALAGQLVVERQASGHPGASVSEVWREVGSALSPPAGSVEEPGTGTSDPT